MTIGRDGRLWVVHETDEETKSERFLFGGTYNECQRFEAANGGNSGISLEIRKIAGSPTFWQSVAKALEMGRTAMERLHDWEDRSCRECQQGVCAVCGVTSREAFSENGSIECAGGPFKPHRCNGV
jgi:hypothetical protein